MPFRINKPGSSEIKQSVPGNAKVEVYQPVAANCQVEPIQTDETKLVVTAKQATAADLNATVVQLTAANLNAQTQEIGSHIRRNYTAAPVVVTLSAATARSTQLTSAKQCFIISNIDCYFLQGTVAVNATTSSHFLPAGMEVPVYITGTNDTYIAGITDGGAGKLFISYAA